MLHLIQLRNSLVGRHVPVASSHAPCQGAPFEPSGAPDMRVEYYGTAPKARAQESSLAKPNYRQQKKQREQAKKKRNDEKLQRKGRKPNVNEQVPTA